MRGCDQERLLKRDYGEVMYIALADGQAPALRGGRLQRAAQDPAVPIKLFCVAHGRRAAVVHDGEHVHDG